MNNKIHEQIERIFSDIYPKAKSAIFLSESETGQVSILALGEIRNAFDHLARAFVSNDDERAITEVKRAETHLNRAMIDSYGLLVIEKIQRYKKISGTRQIDKLKQKKIEHLIKEYLNMRNITSENERSFESYLETYERIIFEINDVLSGMERDEIASNRPSRLWQLFLAAVTGSILTAIILKVFSNLLGN